MNYFYKEQLRKTSSGLGFYVFSCFILMYVIQISLLVYSELCGISSDNNISLFLSMSITSLGSMLIPGFFYFIISGTSPGEIIPFQRVKPSMLFELIFMGLGSAFIGDYVTEILNYNLSLTGISSDISMEYATQTPLENILYILSVAVVPAIAEEFALRGIVLGKLRQYGDAPAIIISAVLFGMLHGNIIQAPFAFVIGLVFGFIVVKTNSLLPTIIIHFLNNLYAVVFELISNSNALSDSQINAAYSISMLVILCLAIISTLILSRDKNMFKLENSGGILTFKEKTFAGFTSVGMVFVMVALLIEMLLTTAAT